MTTMPLQIAMRRLDEAAKEAAGHARGFVNALPGDDQARADALLNAVNGRLREAHMLLGMIGNGGLHEPHPLVRDLGEAFAQAHEQADAAIGEINLDGLHVGADEFEEMLNRHEEASQALLQFEIAGASALIHLQAALDLVTPAESTNGTEDTSE